MLCIILVFKILHLSVIFLVMHMNKADASHAPGLLCDSRQTHESIKHTSNAVTLFGSVKAL